MSQRDLSDYDKEESDTGLYGEPRGYSTPRLSDEEREALERRIILKAAKMLGVDPDELTKEEAQNVYFQHKTQPYFSKLISYNTSGESMVFDLSKLWSGDPYWDFRSFRNF